MSLFFVYGTLKSGYGNHTILGDSELIGEAVTLDAFTLRNCGFPYLIEGDVEEKLPVIGEVYEADSEAEQQMDWLEGVDSGHYSRKQIRVKMSTTEEEVDVNVYYVKASHSLERLRLCDVVDGNYQWS